MAGSKPIKDRERESVESIKDIESTISRVWQCRCGFGALQVADGALQVVDGALQVGSDDGAHNLCRLCGGGGPAWRAKTASRSTGLGGGCGWEAEVDGIRRWLYVGGCGREIWKGMREF
ncbi:hypothetical protein R6Q59_031041 [Mikania micrantha]